MRRPLFSKHEREWLIAFLRAASAGGLAFMGVALMLALLSYHPSDPGVFSATWREPRNWLGQNGAVVADLLHRTIGIAGFAVAGLALVWSVRIHWRAWPTRLAARLAVTPLALLSMAALASGEPEIARSGGGLGGLMGDTLFSMLNSGLPFENVKVRYVAAMTLLTLLTPPLVLAALGVSGWTALRWIDQGRRDLAALLRNGVHAAQGGWRAWGGHRLGGVVSRAVFGVSSGLGAGLGAMASGVGAARAATAGAAPWPDFSEAAAAGRNGPIPRRRRPMPKAPPTAPTSAPRGPETRTEPAFSMERTVAPEPPLAEEIPAAGAPLPDAVPTPRWAAEAAEAGDDLSARRRAADLALHEPETTEQTTPAQSPPAAAEVDEVVSIETDGTPALEQDALAEPPTDIVEEEGPSLDLLTAPAEATRLRISERELAEKVDRLQSVLQDYGVRGEIIHVNPGPVVSLFELEPAPGLKSARVIGLADDIARSMSAAACRISPVPGKNLLGIELPNEARETVLLSELLASSAYQDGDWTLPLALGKDIAGEPAIADLASMPHLLIAGTTGSGKSVAINTMLLSLLYRLSPADVRLLLIDPKMLELSVYNGAPHLLAPVVTDPKKAVSALRWVVREMETRYQRMARLNVRNLESYNARVAEGGAEGAVAREVQTGFCEETGKPLYETQITEAEPMSRIVVVIDEMADLMLVAGKEIERLVQRLAQMARAAGIHLVMATQRPSVDVITGVIKANFPIRISFQVTSKIDSRTILNEPGAEQLLGKGDMLFTTGSGRLRRLHGPFVSDAEVEAVAARLKAMGPVDAPVDFEGRAETSEENAHDDEPEDGDDDLYARAVAIVRKERKASTSFLQRRLSIGYNRAARLVDRMEKEGGVSPANHVGKREVLFDSED